MTRLVSRSVVCAIVLSVASWSPATAQDSARPSHQCLPENSVALARMPSGRAFVAALREQTRLGNVVLSDERMAKIGELLRDQSDQEWDEVVKQLEQYGLTLDDAWHLLDGEAGFALVVQQRGDDEPPLAIGLWWVEPGEGIAERLWKAVETVLEQQEDGPERVRRVNLNLAGRDVVRLTIPVVDLDYEEEPFPDEPTDEALEAWAKRNAERMENAQRVETDQVNVFVAREGNRLIGAMLFPQAAERAAELRGENPDADIDFDELTGVAEAEGVYARFLAAHDDSSPGWVSQVMATPGLAAALPDGTPLVELMFDPKPLMGLAASMADPQTLEVIRAIGVEGLGPVALRYSLDNNQMRGAAFISAPAPRPGLLALLDQQPAPIDPPSWVPANVVGYGHISFDLAAAYTQVKEFAVKQFGESAQQGIQMVEQQASGFLQTDIPTLLGSVGTMHYSLSFEPRLDAETVAEADAEDLEAATTREAVVWQLKDEDLWKRLIQMAAAFAPATEGVLEATEEQGFSGLRIDAGAAAMGVFVGRGFLVLGVGDDVVEPVMAALRSPPEPSAALRGSPLMQRAAELVPAEPCFMFSVVDYDRSIKAARQTVMTMLDAVSGEQSLGIDLGGFDGQDVEVEEADLEQTRVVVEKIKSLIPSDEELDGVLGASASTTRMTDQGLIYTSAMDMPAPSQP